MPRGVLFKPLELEIMAVAIRAGYNAPSIARYLNRDRVAVHRKITAMRKSGEIENTPFSFIEEQIVAALKAFFEAET